jgi:hypothetical protein
MLRHLSVQVRWRSDQGDNTESGILTETILQSWKRGDEDVASTREIRTGDTDDLSSEPNPNTWRDDEDQNGTVWLRSSQIGADFFFKARHECTALSHNVISERLASKIPSDLVDRDGRTQIIVGRPVISRGKVSLECFFGSLILPTKNFYICETEIVDSGSFKQTTSILGLTGYDAILCDDLPRPSDVYYRLDGRRYGHASDIGPEEDGNAREDFTMETRIDKSDFLALLQSMGCERARSDLIDDRILPT